MVPKIILNLNKKKKNSAIGQLGQLSYNINVPNLYVQSTPPKFDRAVNNKYFNF